MDATATETHQTLANDAVALRRQADHVLLITDLLTGMEAAHPARREAAILAAQLPEVFQPIQAGDAFAGRIRYPLAGVSPEPGGYGLYINDGLVRALAERPEVDGERQQRLMAALGSWESRSSRHAALAHITTRDGWRTKPEIEWYGTKPWCGAPLFRICGLAPDLPRLCARGLPGLIADVQARRDADAETQALCDSWLEALAAIDRVLAGYALEAEALGLSDIASSCSRLRSTPPQTLRDALQLALILTGAAGIMNFGRCDDAFGPLLEADLAAHRLDEDGAAQLVLGWFRLIATRRTIYNGRVILGGEGRRHPRAADAFCRAALVATRLQKDIEPQVSLRIGADQDPRLLDLAYDALAAGCTYPMLYQDATNIPAVQRAFHVDRATATTYVPYGCGEYVLGPSSVGAPNTLLNSAHILNECLLGRAPGQDGTVPQYRDIGGLWEDLLRAHQLVLRDLAHGQAASYEGISDTCRLLLPSLCTDGPLERGRALLDGGIRYRGGTMEVYGLANAADAITAIDQVVFQQHRLTLDQLRAALAADFQGIHAATGVLLRRQPKYGNDDSVADLWYCRLHDLVCDTTRDLAPAVGLHHWLVVNINNWANTMFGRWTQSTADGRRAGTALSNANGPSSGSDQEGPTACLASQAKPDAGILAGQTQNLKLSQAWFRGERANLKALLAQYWAAGGTQVMITVSDPGELQAAMERPQDFGHLLVRVGGFSARFVDLPRDCQLEIAQRSLH